MVTTFKDKPHQPCVKPMYEENGKTIYKLMHEDLEYIWEKDGTYYKLIVEEGYLSDLASVPRIAYTMFNITPDGLVRVGSLLHDKICKYLGLMPLGSYFELIDGVWVDISHIEWTRKSGNKLFARVNREVGMSKRKRRWFYRGVRAYKSFNTLIWKW